MITMRDGEIQVTKKKAARKPSPAHHTTPHKG
jgi:hypothetical protein